MISLQLLPFLSYCEKTNKGVGEGIPPAPRPATSTTQIRVKLSSNFRYKFKHVSRIIMMFSAICYQLYNLKNVKNTHGRVLVLVKLHAFICVTKSNTPSWVFFIFFKLYKWYRIAQRITTLNVTTQELMLVFIRCRW